MTLISAVWTAIGQAPSRTGTFLIMFPLLLPLSVQPIYAGENVVKFGGDEITIPKTFVLDTDERRARLTSVASNIHLELLKSDKIPIREGVTIFRGPYPKFPALVAKENGSYSTVSLDNVGHFARQIRTPDEFVALLAPLLEDGECLISVPVFKRLLQAVADATETRQFQIVKKTVEFESVERGCTDNGGYYQWHLLRIDDASVVEEKFVLDKKTNMIGRMRRVLIKGPACPVDNADAGPGSWSEQKKKDYSEWQQCIALLNGVLKRDEKKN